MKAPPSGVRFVFVDVFTARGEEYVWMSCRSLADCSFITKIHCMADQVFTQLFHGFRCWQRRSGYRRFADRNTCMITIWDQTLVPPLSDRGLMNVFGAHCKVSVFNANNAGGHTYGTRAQADADQSHALRTQTHRLLENYIYIYIYIYRDTWSLKASHVPWWVTAKLLVWSLIVALLTSVNTCPAAMTSYWL